MTTKDELGDRMKDYERRETGRRFFPTLPVYARIDGRGFSKFTAGMDRPFDQRMTDAMIEVTKYLVKETHATIGYVQSDEISLVWMAESYESDIFFSGKEQKIVSVLASMAAAKMAQVINGWAPFNARLPHFDARVLQLPNPTEAANMFLFRALDAQKNAVSMACRAIASSKAMHKKGQREMLEMVKAAGVDYDAYPDAFRLGTFVRRQVVERELTEKEIERWPANQRPEPGTLVKRSNVAAVLDVPRFNIVTNRTEFIFDGADPIARVFDDEVIDD